MADRIARRPGAGPAGARRRPSETSSRGIEAAYGSLLHSEGEGFCVIEMVFDREGLPVDYRFIEVNAAFERQTGMADVKGRTARELLPELEAEWLERYGRIARTGRPERWEDEVAELGRWFDVYAWRIGRPSERMLALSLRDISERRQAEIALRESEERLRLAKDAAGMGIHDFDPLSGHIRWDERVRELWGVGADDHVDYDLFMAGIHPDDQERTQVAVDRALDPAGDGEYRVEYRVTSRVDGRTRWVAVTGQATFEDGRAVRLVGTVQDVTALKQAEAALRESEERFRAMADGSPVMIWVDGPDGEVEFINRAYSEFFGMTLEEVRRSTWRSAIHPDDLDEYLAGFRSALRDRSPFHAVTRARNAAGEWRWIESHGAPRFAPDGRFLGIVGSSPDITERKEVEAELREAIAAKDQFLGFISHELRTPMTIILGMSRLLARKLDGAENEMATDIATSAEELNDLIDSLLTLARFDGSRGPDTGPPSHLGRVIERVLQRQRERDPSREYRYRPDSIGPVVDGEEAWLERILVNLVGNAAKYSPSGRPVTVLLEDAADEVQVRVLDEGDGLAAHEIERLFEPFYRGSSHDGQVPGAGLGLAVCKRIVESMGGRMWARTRTSGGAEFGFRLPSSSFGEDQGRVAVSSPRTGGRSEA